MFDLAQADYAFWSSYTLPKYQPIDYVIRWLVVMPSLFWFGSSLLASRRQETLPEGDTSTDDEDLRETPEAGTDAADETAEEAPAEEPDSQS